MGKMSKTLPTYLLYFPICHLIILNTIYSETTELISDRIIDQRGISVIGQNRSIRSNIDYLFALDPVISDALIEDIDPGVRNLDTNRRRDASDYKWTKEHKMKILDLHNLYRGNVTPPAGNMAFMEWDDELEHLAELWAKTCKFEHGRPPSTSYRGGYGQNLYLGTDPTGLRGLWLWYREYLNYHFHNHSCPFGLMCGHYLTMAWASNSKLGCAINQCGYQYLLVCHYSPGASKGTYIYDVSKPCSQCISNPGTLCYKNLCMSKEQCLRNQKKCELAVCNLECHNCGRLDKSDCLCSCADGWDTYDCSRPCENSHERCGIYPGYPSKSVCPFFNNKVENEFCRLMCDKCVPFFENETMTHEVVSHICCDGKLCPRGYILDLNRKPCACKVQCPGPQCDSTDGSGFKTTSNMLLMLLSLLPLILVRNYSTKQ